MTTEPIGQENGMITNRRILEDSSGNLYAEVSFETEGQLKGVDVKNAGTFETRSRPDGSMYGEGRGIIFSPDGRQTPWKGAGAGTQASDGSLVYHSAVYIQPTGGKFDELTRGPLWVEFHVQPDGSVSSTIREPE